MEVVPLSAACAKALVFSWISISECPKRSLQIVGCNLFQIFGPSIVKYYTFHIAKQQHTILSRTVQSKDCTIASRIRFVHAPPRWLGPRSYLLYSLASVHSRGKTLVFPRLRQFFVLQLSCPMNFCKEMNFLSLPQRLELWPLLQLVDAGAWGKPCGDLAKSLVDSQTSWMYCPTLVHSLYISCYVYT